MKPGLMQKFSARASSRRLLMLLGIALLPLPGLASDINKGRTLYNRHCASCHGSNGQNTMAAAANFKRGEGLMQSDLALLRRIERGNKACPAYFGILKEQQILDTIAYIRMLYR